MRFHVYSLVSYILPFDHKQLLMGVFVAYYLLLKSRCSALPILAHVVPDLIDNQLDCLADHDMLKD